VSTKADIGVGGVKGGEVGRWWEIGGLEVVGEDGFEGLVLKWSGGREDQGRWMLLISRDVSAVGGSVGGFCGDRL